MVDCHHHLWDMERHHYEWLEADPIFDTFIGDYSPMCRNYVIQDYLAEATLAGVTKSVHVQCEFDPSNPVGETEWLQDIADQHGFPQGIVGFANLAMKDVGDILEGHASFANFRGIRQNLNWDEHDARRSFADRGDYLADSSWQKGFSLLERFDMSFDLQILPHQMRQAASLVARHPQTPVILNHAGLPLDRTPEAMTQWREGMKLLASLPNMSVKLSGFAMMDQGWTIERIRPVVMQSIELFGVERCMFASNFPVDGLYADYDALFGAYREIVAAFTTVERSSLFADNADRIYRLGSG
ncbi:MAG: amidohydrolase family protein [Acidimicrobiia bacterium]